MTEERLGEIEAALRNMPVGRLAETAAEVSSLISARDDGLRLVEEVRRLREGIQGIIARYEGRDQAGALIELHGLLQT